jgi:hypothetical protein
VRVFRRDGGESPGLIIGGMITLKGIGLVAKGHVVSEKVI